MSRRASRPIFFHQGFVLRYQKTLADGSELLYCVKRPSLGCNASAKRVRGEIFLKTGHNHEADYEGANAKLTRHHIKQIASTTTCSPKQLLKDVQSQLGPLNLGVSRDSMSKMIHRARQAKLRGPPSTPFEPAEKEMEESTSDFQTAMNQFDKVQYMMQHTSSQNLAETNMHDVLDMLIKQEVDEDDTIIKQEVDEDDTIEPERCIDIDQPQNQTINPPEDFFVTLIGTVRDTVKEEMQSAIRSIAASSNTSNLQIQNSSDDISASTKMFLTNLKKLVFHSNSAPLIQRMQAVMEDFENNKKRIDSDKLLESIISQLEKQSD